jgi:hypothetical protein
MQVRQDYSVEEGGGMSFQREQHPLVQSVTLHKQTPFDTDSEWKTRRTGASDHKLCHHILTLIQFDYHIHRKARCSGYYPRFAFEVSGVRTAGRKQNYFTGV